MVFFQGARQRSKRVNPWSSVDGFGFQETGFSGQHGLDDVSVDGRGLRPRRGDWIVEQTIPVLIDLDDGCALGQVGQDGATWAYSVTLPSGRAELIIGAAGLMNLVDYSSKLGQPASQANALLAAGTGG